MALLFSTSPTVKQDLPSWCRVERHGYLGCRVGRRTDASPHRAWTVGRAERGASAPPLARQRAQTAADVLALRFRCPSAATPDTGFAPRGARVEPGGPPYPFSLLERDRVAPPEVAALYDQAVSAQWDATRDVPWDEVAECPPALEAAVGQIMTFLAENELSALYVPSRFLPRIHPAFVETAMFLADADRRRGAAHRRVLRARTGEGWGLGTSPACHLVLALAA